jgi:CBS domain-containing protein
MDPDRFLASHPPFDRLGEDAFDRIRAHLEITYVPRGEVLLRRGEAPSEHLWVVRKGAVRLEREGRVLQVLEEGEPFGFPSLLSGKQPHADVVAEEDSVLLRLPGEVFHKLMEVPRFADFFVSGLSERLRSSAEAGERLTLSGDMALPVEGLVTRPPVFADAGMSVHRAAQRMNEARVSSLLIPGTEATGDGALDRPAGIVTDRDLRSRVLAEGRSADTPVDEVASRPLRTVAAEAPVLTALLDMIEARVHHLGVVSGGRVVGVVTDTDLLRHHHKSPLALLQRIERAADVDALAGYADELTAMVEQLFRGGLDAVEIGRIVSTVHDAAGARLLRLAERELGPAPRPWAWIVFGSEGRREQAVVTDQDNALVYADPPPGGDDEAAVEAWMEALAQRVVDGLVALGIPRCNGGFMATNWCRPLSWWQRTFSTWLAAPEPDALMDAANFFDFRRIGGELSLEPLLEVIALAPQHRSFLAHMAKLALDFRPPLGLFHRIRRQDGGVDLKKGGIMPIVSMARLWALEAGLRNRNTVNRLTFAADAGNLSRQGAEDLSEAFRFLLRLRLEVQLAAVRTGKEPDNLVPIDDLAPLERRHLKDTFLSVREMQTAVGQRYNINLLG